MNKFCKFCRKPIKTAKYLSDFEKSCGECTIHCMKKCKKNYGNNDQLAL